MWRALEGYFFVVRYGGYFSEGSFFDTFLDRMSLRSSIAAGRDFGRSGKYDWRTSVASMQEASKLHRYEGLFAALKGSGREDWPILGGFLVKDGRYGECFRLGEYLLGFGEFAGLAMQTECLISAGMIEGAGYVLDRYETEFADDSRRVSLMYRYLSVDGVSEELFAYLESAARDFPSDFEVIGLLLHVWVLHGDKYFPSEYRARVPEYLRMYRGLLSDFSSELYRYYWLSGEYYYRLGAYRRARVLTEHSIRLRGDFGASLRLLRVLEGLTDSGRHSPRLGF